jgi:hypothetical protein
MTRFWIKLNEFNPTVTQRIGLSMTILTFVNDAIPELLVLSNRGTMAFALVFFAIKMPDRLIVKPIVCVNCTDVLVPGQKA